MKHLRLFESFVKYDPDKKSYEQGDKWDSIFKEYQDYYATMSKKGSYFSLPHWLVISGYYEDNDPVIVDYQKYVKKKSKSSGRFSAFERWARENDIPTPTKR